MDVQVAFSFAEKSVDEVSEYLKTKLDIPEMLCKAFEGNSIVVLRSTLCLNGKEWLRHKTRPPCLPALLPLFF